MSIHAALWVSHRPVRRGPVMMNCEEQHSAGGAMGTSDAGRRVETSLIAFVEILLEWDREVGGTAWSDSSGPPLCAMGDAITIRRGPVA